MSTVPVQPPQPRRAPSLFWPVVLIGIGVILLMSDRGLIVQSPLALVAQYWPVLLIVAGVELLFSRSGALASVISLLLGVAVVVGALVILTTPGAVLQAPLWFTFNGWQTGTGVPVEWRSQHIARPLQEVRNATITLDLPVGSSSIAAARDTPNLIEGDVTYYGAIVDEFQINRDEVVARLGGRQPNGYITTGDRPVRFDYRLNPAAAYDLDVNIGSGNHQFDLSELRLRGLTLNMASGNQVIRLPEAGRYKIELNAASGSTEIVVPRGLPVRVNYRMLSGSINVPDQGRVAGAGKNGTLEFGNPTAGGPLVTIEVDMVSGSLEVR